jgi:hypothetical protein
MVVGIAPSKLEVLFNALRAAFPKQDRFVELVRFDFGQNYNEFQSGDYRATIFAFVEWANAQGEIENLIRAAHVRSGGRNAALQSIVDELPAWLAEPSSSSSGAPELVSDAPRPTSPHQSPGRSHIERSPGTSLRRTSVDRDRERELFTEMLKGERPEHVLLIQAPGGMGKTTLMDEFWDLCEHLPRARVDLKLWVFTAAEILGELSDQLSSLRFDRFYSLRKDLATVSPDQVRQVLQPLTDAFFQDLLLANANESLSTVLLLDSHEKASQEVKDWIAGQFLPRVSRHPRLVTVVAGRDTPEAGSPQKWCLRHELDILRFEDVSDLTRLEGLDLTAREIHVIYTLTMGIPLNVATGVRSLKEDKARGAEHRG